jgi:phosphogluconate dehydratase
VPAAIHVTPEAASGGALGRVRDGDLISLDVAAGQLSLHVDQGALDSRTPADLPFCDNTIGRGLFVLSRAAVTDAESGACTLFPPWSPQTSHSDSQTPQSERASYGA